MLCSEVVPHEPEIICRCKTCVNRKPNVEPWPDSAPQPETIQQIEPIYIEENNIMPPVEDQQLSQSEEESILGNEEAPRSGSASAGRANDRPLILLIVVNKSENGTKSKESDGGGGVCSECQNEMRSRECSSRFKGNEEDMRGCSSGRGGRYSNSFNPRQCWRNMPMNMPMNMNAQTGCKCGAINGNMNANMNANMNGNMNANMNGNMNEYRNASMSRANSSSRPKRCRCEKMQNDFPPQPPSRNSFVNYSMSADNVSRVMTREPSVVSFPARHKSEDWTTGQEKDCPCNQQRYNNVEKYQRVDVPICITKGQCSRCRGFEEEPNDYDYQCPTGDEEEEVYTSDCNIQRMPKKKPPHKPDNQYEKPPKPPKRPKKRKEYNISRRYDRFASPPILLEPKPCCLECCCRPCCRPCCHPCCRWC
ncbi:uncharacterized protein LOC115631620 [Scaptodrosophila lebanonensis]|uniref:Uncharacterized protein LOC115631620 n=1 Tax=Drosophila lebanonensis TaxID=7225 RepID=A0A6J2U6X9_DROLE|nr:uncharacterized protein LOC115631620 [Scaptodrosophila lebanonensis]